MKAFAVGLVNSFIPLIHSVESDGDRLSKRVREMRRRLQDSYPIITHRRAQNERAPRGRLEIPTAARINNCFS